MSESVPELARQLAGDVSRLLARLRGWTGPAWGVGAAAGGTRAERTTALAHELARLGREAGSGAPEDAFPPPLAAHGLADQLAVVADDLLQQLTAPRLAPDRREALLIEAAAAVTAARADLDGPGFGFTGQPG
jgi:hypothetical protein